MFIPAYFFILSVGKVTQVGLFGLLLLHFTACCLFIMLLSSSLGNQLHVTIKSNLSFASTFNAFDKEFIAFFPKEDQKGHLCGMEFYLFC